MVLVMFKLPIYLLISALDYFPYEIFWCKFNAPDATVPDYLSPVLVGKVKVDHRPEFDWL